MNKTQLKDENLSFWAKKFEDKAHIVIDGQELCKHHGALLGNNYHQVCFEICPKCARIYNDDVKMFSVDDDAPQPKSFIFIDNQIGDDELSLEFIEQMKNLDTLKVGEVYSTGGAGSVDIRRIS